MVERNFRNGKSEVGMADYQTRGWLAWHHHMVLVMLALLFLTQERMHSPAPATPEGPINITSFWNVCCPGAAKLRRMRKTSAECWRYESKKRVTTQVAS